MNKDLKTDSETLTMLDQIIFGPEDVDLGHSPLRHLKDETYVLGAFNPSLNRLPSGNLIMMVRIAEGLRHPIQEDKVRQIRWTPDGFVVDEFAPEKCNTTDPRNFTISIEDSIEAMLLTSYSWLLPVEISAQGDIIHIHYDKIIASEVGFQEYGIEDARVSLVDGIYYMTTCSVSAERHCTTLYTSKDGLNFKLEGVILDHQNKDMLIFEGKINNHFYALTRPMGSSYFSYPPQSEFLPTPSINLATSPDALHWKPTNYPFIRARKQSQVAEKVGGGAQPILTPAGWLILYHAVEKNESTGIYRTFWALVDKDNPHLCIHLEDQKPVLESQPELTRHLDKLKYMSDVVFTSGIVEHGDYYIISSGELDLCCRLTHIHKDTFEL